MSSTKSELIEEDSAMPTNNKSKPNELFLNQVLIIFYPLPNPFFAVVFLGVADPDFALLLVFFAALGVVTEEFFFALDLREVPET